MYTQKTEQFHMRIDPILRKKLKYYCAVNNTKESALVTKLIEKAVSNCRLPDQPIRYWGGEIEDMPLEME